MGKHKNDLKEHLLAFWNNIITEVPDEIKKSIAHILKFLNRKDIMIPAKPSEKNKIFNMIIFFYLRYPELVDNKKHEKFVYQLIQQIKGTLQQAVCSEDKQKTISKYASNKKGNS